MIKNLHIQNFKSIKDLKFDCSRINLIIGEPNTGKSNILEALGLFSVVHGTSGIQSYNNLKDIVRADNMTNLFNDNDISKIINIEAWYPRLGTDKFTIKHQNNEFVGMCLNDKTNSKLIEFHVDYNIINNQAPLYTYSPLVPPRYYKFKRLDKFSGKELDYLNPPFGENLLVLLNTRRELYDYVWDFLKGFGYTITLDLHSEHIYIARELNKKLLLFPYSTISDTLLNVIFYTAAIETSKEATLIFEEPETGIFPYYNKFLAERIALYNKNQFFIVTHNPVFVNNIIEKTPDEELRVFISYYENDETKLKIVTSDELDKLEYFGDNIFINLNKILNNG
jgi:AAA15 family ATPase/GTPase